MCFDNSSGLFAIQYYCEQCDVDKIFFIGFDAFIGNSKKDTYYFPYTGNISGTSDPINNDCHDRKLTIDYLQNLGKKYPKLSDNNPDQESSGSCKNLEELGIYI